MAENVTGGNLFDFGLKDTTLNRIAAAGTAGTPKEGDKTIFDTIDKGLGQVEKRVDAYQKAIDEKKKAEEDKTKELALQKAAHDKINKMTGGLFGKYKEIQKLKEEGKAEEASSLMKLTAILSIAGLIGAAFNFMVKMFTNFSKKVTLVCKTFGVMGTDIESGMVKSLTAASHQTLLIGKSLEDVISTVDQLSSNFGLSVTTPLSIFPVKGFFLLMTLFSPGIYSIETC